MNDKICRKCKEAKPLAMFSKGGKSTPDGLAGWCKPCMKSYAADYYKKNTAKMRESARASGLRCYFNLSVEDYENMYRAQNGVCAICSKLCISGRRLAVDHDHATGQIRGLLCYRCNSGLGYFKDSLENLSSAIDYLTRASEKSLRGNIEVKGAL